MALELAKNPHHVLLIFIDGLGIGERDSERNPCAHTSVRFFNHFLDESFPKKLNPHGYALGIDATLGVPGLPQSATGQTALLTGVNAARLLGRHLNGFPNEKLRRVIADHSILKRFVDHGRRAAFLNTFRPPFFDYDPFDIIRYLSVTSVTNLYAGLPFFNLEDMKQERSVYQDMTNESLRAKGFDVPLFTPEKAGEIIGRQSQNYDFSLYEYFQTDRAGHARDMLRARKEIDKLERLLGAVLENIDTRETWVIVTSDHGNIEDVSVKGHTRNPAMTIVFGEGAEDILPSLRDLTDIYRVLCRIFGISEKKWNF